MADCNFRIAFQQSATEVLAKAKAAVEKQGGNFTGDANAGQFDVSLLGSTIAGTYTVVANELEITINDKPFFVPCSAIEQFLEKQLS